ncbi:hypothetical protein Alches_12940 [Alicyclobacillus hesperidum subsp. aegles]|nr:hypothetical protein Alches_12940 [Alicyclobacillus hesperidum subsp. aegles]
MQILDIAGWVIDEDRQAPGTRPKRWVVNPDDGTQWLFKLPRENTGEAWAEQIASKIGRAIGLKTPETSLAISGDSVGSLSLNFIKPGDEFFEGGDLISRMYTAFDRYSLNDYNISVIVEVLQEYGLDKDFMAIPVFDAFIGNQDRHCDNWGIIRSRDTFKLAPLYDNGCSLGHLVKDEDIPDMLRDEERFLGFIRRGKSLIGLPDRKKPKYLELLTHIQMKYPNVVFKNLECLESLTDSALIAILNEVPDAYMSPIKKDFVHHLINKRKNWILNWRRNVG